MTNVFITGCTGFIGSHLTEELIAKGFNVTALVRHRSVKTGIIPSEVTTITGDLLDYFSIKRAISQSQPEIICHTAAATPVRYSFGAPWIYAQTNYIGTINLVHATLDCPVLKRFIHASTAETYEPQPRLMREEDKLFGSTPYGVSKVAADYYVQVAGKCYGLPYTILRPANTYGRKRETGYVTEKIITSMLTSSNVVLDGSPDPVRDYMYASDHVNGYIQSIEADKDGVFNISTGKATSVKQLANTIKEITSFKGEISFMGNPRPYDPEWLVLDNTKAKKELGWQPKVSLEDGLKRTVEYFEENLNRNAGNNG